MPPLAKACASFKGFNPKVNYTDQIYDVLLVVIQRYRSAKPKRFYTMREVAVFFGV